MEELKNRYLIVKQNNLVESKYKLTLQEQKLVLILVSKIQKDDDDLKNYKFKVEELSKFLGVAVNYKQIRKTVKLLQSRIITIEDIDEKGKIITDLNWTRRATYHTEEGIIEIGLNPDLKPYLLQLKESFTKYQLKNIVQLKSVYAIRIYELLKQYEKIGKRTFEIEELKEILGIEENKYKKYSDFKIYVLEKAKDEINDKTDIKIDFEEIKTVRKITSIKFRIIKNEQSKDLEKFPLIEEKNEVKKENYSEEVIILFNLLPNEEQVESRKKEIKKLLKEHSFEMLKSDIKYCNTKSKDNFWGYFIKSCKSGHYSIAEMEKEKAKKQLMEKQKKLVEKRKELEKQEEQFLEETAQEMYKNISEEEKKSYEKKYKQQEHIFKRTGVDLEMFIILNIKKDLES